MMLCANIDLGALPDQIPSIVSMHFLCGKNHGNLGKNPMASKGSPLNGLRIKPIEKGILIFVETRDKEHTFESKAAEEHAKV
ncbi:hypothetical protein VNO77_42888 [Canavalia gladiata]|uniref:Uncharacterized protein n=1 Tax=Canavalia gladiata TaxID=3824 RepID=A0AAN9JVB8_CANGL